MALASPAIARVVAVTAAAILPNKNAIPVSAAAAAMPAKMYSSASITLRFSCANLVMFLIASVTVSNAPLVLNRLATISDSAPRNDAHDLSIVLICGP